jgi:hypothetical protein
MLFRNVEVNIRRKKIVERIENAYLWNVNFELRRGWTGECKVLLQKNSNKMLQNPQFQVY